MQRIALVMVLLLTLGVPGSAERPEPEVVATIDGDDLLRLLPLGGIPAIDEPEFLLGLKATDQMKPEEPVIGVVVGDEARAYSLWQLDAHEIVNDRIKGSAIAVTW